jgi:hypothetical protein
LPLGKASATAAAEESRRGIRDPIIVAKPVASNQRHEPSRYVDWGY